MKKFLLFLFVFVQITSYSFAQDFWQQTNPRDIAVIGLTVDNSGTIYANSYNEDGIYKSTDDGNHWIQIQNGIDTSYQNGHFYGRSIFINNGIIFAGEGGEILKSIDNGLTWDKVIKGDDYEDIKSFDSKTIYAIGYSTGVIKTTDQGITWDTVSSGLKGNFWCISMDLNKNLYVGSANNGIFKSTNEGENWIQITNGIPKDADIRAITTSPNGWIFAATADSGIYRSSDSGNSWSSCNNDLSNNLFIHSLIITNAGKIFASSHNNGVFTSTDEGNNWSQINSALNDSIGFVWSFAIGLNGYLFAGTYNSGVLKSTNLITKVNNNTIYLPSRYKLFQNYPNPFNPTTTINYSIPKASFVTIKVYDLLGKEVATLVNEVKSIGNYNVEFNASILTSGIYFYRMKAGSFVETKKLILLK